jgi:hypothetical protein
MFSLPSCSKKLNVNGDVSVHIAAYCCEVVLYLCGKMRGPFAKFVNWRQCAVVMQRGAVTVIPSCSGGG